MCSQEPRERNGKADHEGYQDVRAFEQLVKRSYAGGVWAGIRALEQSTRNDSIGGHNGEPEYSATAHREQRGLQATRSEQPRKGGGVTKRERYYDLRALRTAAE